MHAQTTSRRNINARIGQLLADTQKHLRFNDDRPLPLTKSEMEMVGEFAKFQKDAVVIPNEFTSVNFGGFRIFMRNNGDTTCWKVR